MSWTDKSGNFWLFSGAAPTAFCYPAVGPSWVNDLWKFQPSANVLPPAAMPVFSLIPGLYASAGPLLLSNGMANASIGARADTCPRSHTNDAGKSPTPKRNVRRSETLGKRLASQFTVSDTVAVCWRDPAVAVTVTIDVVDLLLSLPHPLSDNRVTMHTAGISTNCQRRFLRLTKHRATAASIEPEESRLK
jgi:hypothetical protein